MKHLNNLIRTVLAVSLVAAFVQCKKAEQTPAAPDGRAETAHNTSGLRIAYINVDSLLAKYNFSIDLNEQIVKKQESARANYTQQARSFQAELENFQYKVQNNAFATAERAEQEQQRLQKKQQELMALDERLSQELVEETRRMNEQLRDTIVSHLKEYNKEKGYNMILSNTAGSPIFLADDSFNITDEVVDYLNKRWSSPAR